MKVKTKLVGVHYDYIGHLYVAHKSNFTSIYMYPWQLLIHSIDSILLLMHTWQPFYKALFVYVSYICMLYYNSYCMHGCIPSSLWLLTVNMYTAPSEKCIQFVMCFRLEFELRESMLLVYGDCSHPSLAGQVKEFEKVCPNMKGTCMYEQYSYRHMIFISTHFI